MKYSLLLYSLGCSLHLDWRLNIVWLEQLLPSSYKSSVGQYTMERCSRHRTNTWSDENETFQKQQLLETIIRPTHIRDIGLVYIRSPKCMHRTVPRLEFLLFFLGHRFRGPEPQHFDDDLCHAAANGDSYDQLPRPGYDVRGRG